jgi:hypothetical protein
MQYAMLVHYKPGYYKVLSAEEQKVVFGEYRALAEDPRARGSAQLQPVETATTVRVQDGQTVTTAGPYAASDEGLGAYFVFESDDIDEAIELAARVPAARLGGAVEVRPLAER